MNLSSQRRRPNRVSKQHPCPICGKTDWCMVGDAFVVCMKVPSDRPKEMADGTAGWLHPVATVTAPRPVREEKPAPILNVGGTLQRWSYDCKQRSLIPLSARLGVTEQSLQLLNCLHAPYRDVWAFPMRDGNNGFTGIRLRKSIMVWSESEQKDVEQADKWAERGSHSGLFIPQTKPQALVLIVEGPTDTAAALTIGYFAIGRPNCCGGIEHLKVAIRKLRIQRAVIVSDLDDPGLRGAHTLAEHLPIPTAIMVCPVKDMRAFVNHGGDQQTMDAIISTLVWRQPR